MTDPRPYSKKELKALFTHLERKGITDDMMERLIETLWRNKYTMRTSGFANTGGPDAVIAFDNATRIFSITPLDPEVETYVPRFAFYTWNYTADYHQRFSKEEIELPDEEGLYCIYYDTEETDRVHKLFYAKNPGELKIKNIFYSKVIVTFIYWDAAAGEALHFGDDRHGSEWTPQIHWYLHNAFRARRKTGLQFTGYSLNGDGSLNDHAKFNITGGVMLHDDFEITIPGSSTSIPVLYSFGTLPRFLANAGYAFAGSSRVYYNSGQISLAQADSGNYVLYHIFATNEILTASRKIISVMGTAQYTTLADAFQGVNPELDGIVTYIPHQGRCYLGSIIVQTSDDFANDVKARIVALTGNEMHPPVTIAEGSKQYLSIDEKQELAYNSTALNETIAETIETNNNTTIPEIIKSSIGFSRESWLIEDTSLTEITQLSNWFVVSFNELVGNFKATVMVRDKVTNAIVTVQNTFGFDYTDAANEVGDDNAIITDIAISLVLSVDAATDKLQAVVSGMTSNAKRIHFCFERCVLSQREIELTGTASMALSMEGVLDTAMELAGIAEMGFGMEAGIDSAMELAGTAEIGVGMVGELLAEESITISTLSLTVINGTSLSATGDLSGSNIDEMGFVYNTTGNPTIADTKAIHLYVVGNFTNTLNVATCGTLYYVRAFVTKLGKTIYGDVLTATSSNAGLPNVSLMEAERSSCGTFLTSSLETCQALLDNLRNNTCDQNGYSDTYTSYKLESVTVGKKMYYGGGSYCLVASLYGWNIYNPFGGVGNSIIVQWDENKTIQAVYPY